MRDYVDGINIFNSLKEDALKVTHWVEYALTSIRKDKRERASLKFDKYFSVLSEQWAKALSSSNIDLKFSNKIKSLYFFKAFEMDFNTIFGNLIANSIDSFSNLKTIKKRVILIDYRLSKQNIIFTYSDNGTGISKAFQKNKDDIFLPFVTSKKTGTGLGMYLVKSVIEDNNGNYILLDSKEGFKMKIEFPIKLK